MRGLAAVLALAVAPCCQQLLADLNPFSNDPSSMPGPFVPFGQGVVFGATNDSVGRELWFWRAGNSSAALLGDLWPGPLGAGPQQLVVAGAMFFFFTDDGAGYALWASDGTAAGTRRLRTLRMAFLNEPQTFAVGSRVFAIADDGVFGPELWVSDGTVAGTQMVTELEPGSGGCRLVAGAVLGSELFFAVRTPHVGPRRTLLVRSNGTAAGTTVLTNTDLGGPLVLPSMAASNALVFFGGSPPTGPQNFELWRTDGTTAGTQQVVDLDPNAGSFVGSLQPFQGGVAYLGRVSAYGDEPILSDGSVNGTIIVDVNRQVGRGSSPAYLTEMGGDLFLMGITTAGAGLFRIEGAQRTVSMVQAVNFTPPTAVPNSQIVAAGNRLFFRAVDAASQARTAGQLWVTDGTPAGTSVLRELRAGLGDSEFAYLTAYGNDAVFANNDGLFGAEPWFSDGTAAMTGLAVNLRTSASATGRGSSPVFFARARSRTVFDADDGDRGRELFVTAGIPGDARRLADLVPGFGGVYALRAVGSTSSGPLSGTVLVANELSSPSTYYLTDGTTAGTRALLAPVTLGPPADLASNDRGRLAFAATWRAPSGPTILGTALVRVVGDAMTLVAPPFADPLGGPAGVQVIGERVFYGGDSAATGVEPCVDGVLVRDLWPGPQGSGAGGLLRASLHGRYLFAANDGSSGYELWSSDGTATGTVQVIDLAPGSASSLPARPCVSGGLLFFVADVPGSGRELCVTDGTRAGTRVIDIEAGARGSDPGAFVAQHGGVYFQASTSGAGLELWFCDGTAARQIADINPGVNSSSPRYLMALGSRRVIFVADDGVEGLEPWITDGTAAGTRRLAAIQPGPNDSMIGGYSLAADGRVLFAADDGRVGLEPWVFDPGAVTVPLGGACGFGVATLTASDPLLGANTQIEGTHDSRLALAGVLMLSTPLDLPFGLADGCSLLADPGQIAVPVAMPMGVFRVQVFVPAANRFVGLVLHAQAVVGPLPGSPPWALSNGVALRLGR